MYCYYALYPSTQPPSLHLSLRVDKYISSCKEHMAHNLVNDGFSRYTAIMLGPGIKFDKYLYSKAYISKVLSSLLILLRTDYLPHVNDQCISVDNLLPDAFHHQLRELRPKLTLPKCIKSEVTNIILKHFGLEQKLNAVF